MEGIIWRKMFYFAKKPYNTANVAARVAPAATKWMRYIWETGRSVAFLQKRTHDAARFKARIARVGQENDLRSSV